MLVQPKQPSPEPAVCQRTKHGLGAAEHASVRLNQLHRGFESREGQFGETPWHVWILERAIVNASTGYPPPAADPKAAEVAVSVEDKQRFIRLLYDVDRFCHEIVLPGLCIVCILGLARPFLILIMLLLVLSEPGGD